MTPNLSYDPFAMPTLPPGLLQAVGLHAGGQALPDAHLLAAVAPQTNGFFMRSPPNPATHALITSLLTESMDEPENGFPEAAEGDEDEELDKEAQRVSPNVQGFLDMVSDQMREELKKMALSPVRGVGVGTAELKIGPVPEQNRRDSVQHAMGLAKRRSTYSGKVRSWKPLEAGNLVASSVASSDASSDATKSAVDISQPACEFGQADHLAVHLSQPAWEFGQSLQADTRTSRPGDLPATGSHAYDRIVPVGTAGRTKASTGAMLRPSFAAGPPQKSAQSSILLKLLAAKGSSDQRNYDKKHAIMRELMMQRPADFEKEPPEKGIQGITHKPTGFRLHLPQRVVPVSGT